MPQASFKLRNPPVVEAVLSVQFASFPGWTNGHLGWFWRQYLGDDWGSPSDAAPCLINSSYSAMIRNGRSSRILRCEWHRHLRAAFSSRTRPGTAWSRYNRLAFSTTGRSDSIYPSYETMRSEFDRLYTSFCRFVSDAGLGEAVPNQWEITYVDHIPRGTIWSSPADWSNILPGILRSEPQLGGSMLESIGGERHYVIEPVRGRIHVSLRNGRTTDSNFDVLVLQTTARTDSS